jgi:hypothetical protein
VKVAVKLVAAVTVTVHVVLVPRQAPPQPVNFAPVAGVAVRVKVVLGARLVLHAVEPLPQEIAPPLTRPLPLTATVSWTDGPVPPVNVAVTLFAVVIVTMQVEVPKHAPPHPVKVAPETGVANRVTTVFRAWFAVHTLEVLPQLIPPPVTVPFPVTLTDSATVAVPAAGPPVNVAFTFLDVLIDTVHVVADPPHASVQAVKVAPVAGVAISVRVVPMAKLAEQMLAPLPQLIAPVPPLMLPLPVTLTVSWAAGVKVAVTARSTSMVRVQVAPVPTQAPVQPVNR